MSEERSSETAQPSVWLRLRQDWRNETALGYWLSLPWRCRIFGHALALHESFNENVPFIPEEAWYECKRCSHFGGFHTSGSAASKRRSS